MNKVFTINLLSLIVLAGCAVGPDYEPPQIPVQSAFFESGENATKQPVDILWWKHFSDPILDELITSALKQNLTLQSALARVNQSRAVEQQQFLDLFPTIRADADYTVNQFGGQSQFGGLGGSGGGFRTEVYQAGFDAVWELDFFGRVRREVEQAQGLSEASVAELDDAIRVLISEVARNYLELRGAQAQIAVAKSNAGNQEQVVTVADSLFKGGQTTEFDVMRAKALFYSTLATVPTLEANTKVSMFRLSVLIGQQPHELVSKLAEAKPVPVFSGPITLSDPAALIQRRPDVRAAERRLASATAGVGVAQGDFFPKVSFVGNIFAQSRNRFNPLYSNPGESFSYGPKIQWAAFDLPRVFARVDAAEESVKESLATYHQSVLTALEDVESSLVRFSASRQRRDLLQQSVDQNSKAVQIAKIQYENGLIDLLPVLDAQRSLFIAQEQLTASETELNTSLVSLYKALSGGWEEALGVKPGEKIEEGAEQQAPVTPVLISSATVQEVAVTK